MSTSSLGLELEEGELDDIIQDYLDETHPNLSEATSATVSTQVCCWGFQLRDDHRGALGNCCDASFTAGHGHFKNKFCAQCRSALGINVSATRIRVLPPAMHASYPNINGRSPWTAGARLVNQTAKCTGPWTMIFEARVPPELQGVAYAPPERWMRRDAAGHEYVKFIVSKGTLVPKLPDVEEGTLFLHHGGHMPLGLSRWGPRQLEACSSTTTSSAAAAPIRAELKRPLADGDDSRPAVEARLVFSSAPASVASFSVSSDEGIQLSSGRLHAAPTPSFSARATSAGTPERGALDRGSLLASHTALELQIAERLAIEGARRQPPPHSLGEDRFHLEQLPLDALLGEEAGHGGGPVDRLALRLAESGDPSNDSSLLPDGPLSDEERDALQAVLATLRVASAVLRRRGTHSPSGSGGAELEAEGVEAEGVEAEGVEAAGLDLWSFPPSPPGTSRGTSRASTANTATRPWRRKVEGSPRAGVASSEVGQPPASADGECANGEGAGARAGPSHEHDNCAASLLSLLAWGVVLLLLAFYGAWQASAAFGANVIPILAPNMADTPGAFWAALLLLAGAVGWNTVILASVWMLRLLKWLNPDVAHKLRNARIVLRVALCNKRLAHALLREDEEDDETAGVRVAVDGGLARPEAHGMSRGRREKLIGWLWGAWGIALFIFGTYAIGAIFIEGNVTGESVVGPWTSLNVTYFDTADTTCSGRPIGGGFRIDKMPSRSHSYCYMAGGGQPSFQGGYCNMSAHPPRYKVLIYPDGGDCASASPEQVDLDASGICVVGMHFGEGSRPLEMRPAMVRCESWLA